MLPRTQADSNNNLQIVKANPHLPHLNSALHFLQIVMPPTEESQLHFPAPLLPTACATLRRSVHDTSPSTGTVSAAPLLGVVRSGAVLTVKIRQPSHEFTFGVGMSFIPYPLVLTPVV
jgi:hypothetical protein